MKKKFLLLLFAVMLSHSSFFAQGNSKFTKDYIPLSPEQSFQDKRIRNSNATDFIIGNEKIEKRIAKYYSEDDLKSIDEKEARRINYIYLKSFEVVNKSDLTKVCLSSFERNFDTSGYNHLRNKDSRKIINIVFESCEIELSLYSWNEIDNQK